MGFNFNDYDIGQLRQNARFDEYGMDPSLDMEDPFNPLRRNRRDMMGFGPEPVGEGLTTPMALPQSTQLPPNKRPIVDPIDLMKAYYQPETAATDRYNQFLREAPEVDTNPSFGRKFVASMAGIGKGGIEDAEKVLSAPYLRKMADWKAKADPIYNAANLERQSNIQNRTLASNRIAADTQESKTLQRADEAEAKDKTRQEEIASKERIAQAKNAVERAWRLGYTFEKVGNKLFGVRSDGSRFEAGEAKDYSPLELETLRQKGRIELEEKKTEGDVKVKQATPGGKAGTASGDTSDKEYKTVRNNILQRAYDNDRYRKFIEPPANSAGSFQLKSDAIRTDKWFNNSSEDDKAAFSELQEMLGIKPKGLAPTTIPGPTGKESATRPPEAKSAPIGPSKPPEPTQRRPEYSARPTGPNQPQSDTPWIVGAGKRVIEAAKNAGSEPQNEPNVYGQKPGYTHMKDAQTGADNWIPNNRVADAEKSGRYVRVRK